MVSPEKCLLAKCFAYRIGLVLLCEELDRDSAPRGKAAANRYRNWQVSELKSNGDEASVPWNYPG